MHWNSSFKPCWRGSGQPTNGHHPGTRELTLYACLNMEKTGAPGGNPHNHRENLHTPHRKALPQPRVEPFLLVGNGANAQVLPAWDQTVCLYADGPGGREGSKVLVRSSYQEVLTLQHIESQIQNSSISSFCTSNMSTTRWPWNSTTNVIVQVNNPPEVKPPALLLNCPKTERECRATST